MMGRLRMTGLPEKTKAAVRLAATLMLIGNVAASAQDAAGPRPLSVQKLERITDFFDNEVALGRIPGAIVYIERDRTPYYFRCFGYRDARTKAPMTPDTIFALHSLSKPITNVAAMMLIDRGQIGLDDPVAKYIPSFRDIMVGEETKTADGKPTLHDVPPIRPPTIRDLMRQTSGISYDYIGGELIREAYDGANLYDGNYDNAEFADRIAKLPLARQPGSLWRYGHSTDVLGRVIEVVTGKTLYQFEKENLFDPLGMKDTKYLLTTPSEKARMAEPLPGDQELQLSETERRRHTNWQSGGGGLLSTVGDYAQFLRMIAGHGELDGRRYLSPASFKLMTTDQIGPGSGVGRDYFYYPGDGFDYTLGFGLRVSPGDAVPPPPGSIGELKWDGGSGVYFGVDPKEHTIYMLFEQTGTQRGRILPAVKKLFYDSFGN